MKPKKQPHFYCEDLACRGPAKLVRTTPPGSDDSQALPGGVRRKWRCTVCGETFFSCEFKESTYKKMDYQRHKQAAARVVDQVRALLRAAGGDCL